MPKTTFFPKSIANLSQVFPKVLADFFFNVTSKKQCIHISDSFKELAYIYDICEVSFPLSKPD